MIGRAEFHDDVIDFVGESGIVDQGEDEIVHLLVSVALTDGHQRILDKHPNAMHERTPLIIGSPDEVKRVLSF